MLLNIGQVTERGSITTLRSNVQEEGDDAGEDDPPLIIMRRDPSLDVWRIMDRGHESGVFPPHHSAKHACVVPE